MAGVPGEISEAGLGTDVVFMLGSCAETAAAT
jgi:hypothetical protein